MCHEKVEMVEREGWHKGVLAQSLTDSGAIEIQKHNPGTHGSLGPWVWFVLTHKRSRYKRSCQRINLPCGLGGKIDIRHKPKAHKRSKAYRSPSPPPPSTVRVFASWSFSHRGQLQSGSSLLLTYHQKGSNILTLRHSTYLRPHLAAPHHVGCASHSIPRRRASMARLGILRERPLHITFIMVYCFILLLVIVNFLLYLI